MSSAVAGSCFPKGLVRDSSRWFPSDRPNELMHSRGISDGLFRVENDREYDLLLRWLGKQWPRRSTPTSVHVFDVGADRAMPVHFWQVPTGL